MPNVFLIVIHNIRYMFCHTNEAIYNTRKKIPYEKLVEYLLKITRVLMKSGTNLYSIILQYIIVILTRGWNWREKKNSREVYSNPQPSDYEAALLPTRPPPHLWITFRLVYIWYTLLYRRPSRQLNYYTVY